MQKQHYQKSRRHSNSDVYNSLENTCSDLKRCTGDSTYSSDDATSSIGALEYSSMIDEWVGDCWGEMEDQLMKLSGNDFKTFALSPNKSSDQESQSHTDPQKSENEPLLDHDRCSTGAEVVSSSKSFDTPDWNNNSPPREGKGSSSPSRIARRNSRRYKYGIILEHSEKKKKLQKILSQISISSFLQHDLIGPCRASAGFRAYPRTVPPRGRASPIPPGVPKMCAQCSVPPPSAPSGGPPTSWHTLPLRSAIRWAPLPHRCPICAR